MIKETAKPENDAPEQQVAPNNDLLCLDCNGTGVHTRGGEDYYCACTKGLIKFEADYAEIKKMQISATGDQT